MADDSRSAFMAAQAPSLAFARPSGAAPSVEAPLSEADGPGRRAAPLLPPPPSGPKSLRIGALAPTPTEGLRIGLLGGSFDPPHAGHVHITDVALRTLRLDRVWWLVSPGNPLKRRSPADLQRRLEACRALMRHPRVAVTDLETRIGTRFTADTLAFLLRRFSDARFVWLMGADNLASFHRWEHWDAIMRSAPIGVLARPNAQLHAGLAPAAQRYARWRVPQSAAGGLALRRAPAWSLVTGPMSPLSSTAIRESGAWP